MAEKHEQDVYIYIEPDAKGHFAERDLIGAYGAVSVHGNYSDFSEASPQRFFKVNALGYSLEAGFLQNEVYVTRNDIELKLPLKPKYFKRSIWVNGSLQDIYEAIEAKISISWTPTQLKITRSEFISAIDVSSRQDLEHKVIRYLPVSSTHPLAKKNLLVEEVFKDTQATRPPNKLLEWVRDNLVEVTTYDSSADFYKDAVALFLSVLDTVKTANSYSAFWDENKGRRTPKKEPKITAIIHSYLLVPARVKGFEVVHQHLEAGILDFRISTFLTNGKRATVCIECKHAHSSDLLPGLTNQLPTYMLQRECEFGIYFVLWFKGADFLRPKNISSPDSLVNSLSVVARNEGIHNIRILPFDLSYPEMPSHVTKDPDLKPSWATPENMFRVEYVGLIPTVLAYHVNLDTCENEKKSKLQ
jgi:hypothetical protein